MARGTSGGAAQYAGSTITGDYLNGYGLLRVSHPEVAEDFVQKTLCTAIRACRKIVRAKLALWNLKTKSAAISRSLTEGQILLMMLRRACRTLRQCLEVNSFEE